MNEIQGLVRNRIHEGKFEEFKRLAAKCIDSVRTKDSWTLQYDWFFNADESECVVHERYRDSDALLQTWSISGELFGTPSPKLLKALESFDVRIYSPYQSFRPPVQAS